MSKTLSEAIAFLVIVGGSVISSTLIVGMSVEFLSEINYKLYESINTDHKVFMSVVLSVTMISLSLLFVLLETMVR